MLIISDSIKISKNDIAKLSNKHLIINNVNTAYGTDDTYISIEHISIKK